jgi:hypothetical protein
MKIHGINLNQIGLIGVVYHGQLERHRVLHAVRHAQVFGVRHMALPNTGVVQRKCWAVCAAATIVSTTLEAAVF